MKTNILYHRWIISGTTDDEGWKIVTEDAYIGNEDDGMEREWIATVYDRETAEHIVELHNIRFLNED
jgi:hypothetical protein